MIALSSPVMISGLARLEVRGARGANTGSAPRDVCEGPGPQSLGYTRRRLGLGAAPSGHGHAPSVRPACAITAIGGVIRAQTNRASACLRVFAPASTASRWFDWGQSGWKYIALAVYKGPEWHQVGPVVKWPARDRDPRKRTNSKPNRTNSSRIDGPPINTNPGKPRKPKSNLEKSLVKAHAAQHNPSNQTHRSKSKDDTQYELN